MDDMELANLLKATLAGKLVDLEALSSVERATLFRKLQQEYLNLKRAVQQAVPVVDHRQILDALPVLISYMDRDLYYRFSNRAHQQQFGHDVTGRHVQTVVPESFFNAVKPYIDQVLAGQPVSYSNVRYLEDGRTQWLDADYIPHMDEHGHIPGYFALVRDVTSRRQAEQHTLDLQRITAAFSKALTLDEVLTVINAEMIPLLRAHRALLLCFQPDQHTLEVVSHYQLAEQTLQAYQHLTLDSSGLITLALRQQEPVWIESPEELLRDDPHLTSVLEAEPVQSALYFPLIDHGKKIGIITLAFKEKRTFDSNDRAYIGTLMQQCAQGIARAQTYQTEAQLRVKAETVNNRLKQLQAVMAALSGVTTLDEMAEIIGSQGFAVLGAHMGMIGLMQGEQLEAVVQYGISETLHHQYRTIPLTAHLPIVDAIRCEEFIWLGTPEAYADQYPGTAAATLPITQSQSVLAFPLLVAGEIIGAMSMSFRTPKPYDLEEHAFILSLVHQCAQTLQRIRLYTAEHEQRQLAEALQEIAIAVSSSLDIQEVIQKVLSSIEKVVPHDAAKIILLDEQGTTTVTCRGYHEHGLAAFEAILVNSPNLIKRLTWLHHMYESRHPLLIADTRHDLTWLDVPEATLIKSFVGVPILSQDKILGFIGLDCLTPGFFTPRHVAHLQAFAAQISTAIQNAQRYQQAQTIAILEERQRLARDLHDAVSQMLFSSSVTAQALSKGFSKNPEKIPSILDQLYRLNRGALAEMRTLLLELRQADLMAIQLPELLQQLVEAAMGHTHLEIDLHVEGTATLPEDVQIAFYRIAQEALNNMVKHAHATQAEVRLALHESASLTIRDNGRGFVIRSDLANHFGLKIMRERATRIGANLQIDSQPGAGTTLTLTWTNLNLVG